MSRYLYYKCMFKTMAGMRKNIQLITLVLKTFKISLYFPFALRVKYDNYEIQFV